MSGSYSGSPTDAELVEGDRQAGREDAAFNQGYDQGAAEVLSEVKARNPALYAAIRPIFKAVRHV